MWKPSQKIIDAAFAHAEADQPREACGVVAGGKYHPIPNVITGMDTFAMDMRAYVRIDKKTPVEAIVHSHVYNPAIPSDADLTMCETTGKPWMIINWPTGAWMVTEPSGFRAPLVGRSWAWGCHDCWTLIQDGMEFFAGIDLPDYQPPFDFFETGNDFMVEHFAEAGLVPVEDDEWRHCDIAAMQIWPSVVVNHMGLILSPDLLLHQLAGRLSVREVFGGFYAKCTRYHLRHERLLEAAPPIPDHYLDWRSGACQF